MVQQTESRLMTEWLNETHRTHLCMKRVRLGKAVNQEEAAMFSVMLRWADAIVIDGNVLYIVEAKLRAGPGAVGQLELYAKLLKETPEFSQYQDKEVRLVLLSGNYDAATEAFCMEKGIEFVYFPRPWLGS